MSPRVILAQKCRAYFTLKTTQWAPARLKLMMDDGVMWQQQIGRMLVPRPDIASFSKSAWTTRCIRSVIQIVFWTINSRGNRWMKSVEETECHIVSFINSLDRRLQCFGVLWNMHSVHGIGICFWGRIQIQIDWFPLFSKETLFWFEPLRFIRLHSRNLTRQII